MHRTALVLVSFAIIFSSLCVASYRQKSATWDEPQHLTTGLLALRHGDYRLDPEHPPFARIWAALPVGHVDADTSVIDPIRPEAWVGAGQFFYAHKFMYRDNDADRLLYRARFMNVLLGVLLGVLVFCWVREWLGFWPATLALTLFCFEPSIQAHASLVTTDLPVACFMFGAVYFAWRICRMEGHAPSWPRPGNGRDGARLSNITGLTGFFALAIVTKFTALLLGPIVLLLLIIARVKPARIAGLVALLAVASWLAVWAVYGFRYAPSDNPDWLYRFHQEAQTLERVPTLARVVGWMDEYRLLPNAFSQGFLHGQWKAQARSAFLAGEISTTGWWYYFPVGFALKTPVALLVLMIAGVAALLRSAGSFPRLTEPRLQLLFVVLPALIYFGVAMTQRLNIGVRHLLPVVPLVIVLAAAGAQALWRYRWLAPVLLVFAVLEFARAYPHNLAFFNVFAGGPANGYKWLVDSNLDWGQDLKPLKRWMDANGVEKIALSYFGTADAGYYGIRCTHLPGSPFYETPAAPELPGYVAVSATNLQGVYLGDAGRAFYRPLLEREPVARIGHSIFVYRVERPWW